MYLRRGSLSAFFAYLLSVMFQRIYFHFSGRKIYQFTFACGLYLEQLPEGLPWLDLLALCLPIIFLLLYYSGNYICFVEGYGRLLMIRHYSKSRMILQQSFWMAGNLLVLVFLEIMVWKIRDGKYENMTTPFWQIFISYYICLCALVFLQYFLETFLPAQAANLMVVIYLILSQLAAHSAEGFAGNFLEILFFPALLSKNHEVVNQAAVSVRNLEVVNQAAVSVRNLAVMNQAAVFVKNLAGVWIFPGVLSVIFVALSIYRCRKKDIY